MANLSKELNRTRNLPRAALHLIPPTRLQALIEGTGILYEATAEIAGNNVLVDASKVPFQLSLLQHQNKFDIRLLHLVRDGRAVAYSWSKRVKEEPAKAGGLTYMPRHSAFRSMLTWIVENIATMRAARQTPYKLMRYEDFVGNPHGVLTQTLQALDIPDINLDFLAQENFNLHPTHSVGGNPIRFSRDPVSIKPDERWRRDMTPANKLLLGLFAWPLMKKFQHKLL